MIGKHKYPYRWKLSDGYPKSNDLKVFSCFACGGGSTMGYKLAGFEVLGANEIDPKMAECYKLNHKPKYLYIEPIQEFKDREDLPAELYDLDILDGSPPCSSFSMAGNREKDWGEKKTFREGQAKQVLDTLFFDFIDLAKKLQPKVVIAENVKGLLLGEAKEYVKEIYKAFDKAGYYLERWLLDASKMGVPQRRERVFFIALRKDLASKVKCEQKVDLFNPMPYLDMLFNELEIPFSEISLEEGIIPLEMTERSKEIWDKVRPGKSYASITGGSGFGWLKTHPDRALPTITAGDYRGSSGLFHYSEKRNLYNEERILGGTYPEDYNFNDFIHPTYLIGMSVPPVMTAQIATRIKEQWFDRMIDERP